MLRSIRQILTLVNMRDKVTIIAFGLARSLLGLLDIAGLLLVGILLTTGTSELTKSDSSKKVPGLLSNFLESYSYVEIAAIALGLFLSKSILASVFMKLVTQKFASAEAKISSELYAHLLTLPITDLTKRSKSDLVYSLTYAAGYGITSLLSTTIIVLSEAFLLFSIIIFFALVDFNMAVIIFSYFALVGFLIHKTIGAKMQSAGKRAASGAINSSAAVEDSIIAFREIKALGKQNTFNEKFVKSRTELAKASAEIEFLLGLPRHLVESALMVGAVGLVAFTLQSENVADAAGTLGVFLTGSLRIMASMLPLQNSLGNMKQLRSRSEIFFELADEYRVSKMNTSQSKILESTLKESRPVGIKFSNVSYRYSNSESTALSDLSFDIQKGQVVALIGPSGSGKSTTADLIIGLIKPTTGNIYLENGNNNKFGYVPQAPGIISGTILENITLDSSELGFDVDLLENALSMSHLTELVDDLEFGIHTQLGAQSDGLSGGQLQRIGLARALYADPGLLVLDEATSALDAETEAAVSASLMSLRGKCTTVVIAHRLSTVQNADVVFVLDDGKIVASGKFSDLAKSNELVAKYIALSELNTN